MQTFPIPTQARLGSEREELFTCHTRHPTRPMHVTDRMHPALAMGKPATWRLRLSVRELMVTTCKGELQTNTGRYEGGGPSGLEQPPGANSAILDTGGGGAILEDGDI